MEMGILNYVVDFLQRAHKKDERYTVRDGINIARYAGKIISSQRYSLRRALKNAIKQILGEEALVYLVLEPRIVK